MMLQGASPIQAAERWRCAPALLAIALLGGCGSLKRMAINQLGDALAGDGSGATAYAADDCPSLIRDATPFSLKLMETVLAENPRHRKLLLATSRGFTQYAYGFVKQEADETEDADIDRAVALRADARKLLLRARDYGLKSLELDHAGFGARLRASPSKAVAGLGKSDVPKLYWTGAAWGGAISLAKDDPELIGDLPIVEKMMERALALDEAYSEGAIHGFFIAYEMSRSSDQAAAAAKARAHFERAVALSKGLDASYYVSLAESVAIPLGDRKEFESLLNKAVAVDADARPDLTLSNTVFQQRARWLLSRKDRLFLE